MGKKQNNGVAFRVRGPDAFLHRQLAVGSRGLCQGGGWRRDRASGEPQTTTDGAAHSSLSSTPNQPSARAAGCFEGHTLTGSERGRPAKSFCSQTIPLTSAAEGSGYHNFCTGDRCKCGAAIK